MKTYQKEKRLIWYFIIFVWHSWDTDPLQLNLFHCKISTVDHSNRRTKIFGEWLWFEMHKNLHAGKAAEDPDSCHRHIDTCYLLMTLIIYLWLSTFTHNSIVIFSHFMNLTNLSLTFIHITQQTTSQKPSLTSFTHISSCFRINIVLWITLQWNLIVTFQRMNFLTRNPALRSLHPKSDVDITGICLLSFHHSGSNLFFY